MSVLLLICMSNVGDENCLRFNQHRRLLAATISDDVEEIHMNYSHVHNFLNFYTKNVQVVF